MLISIQKCFLQSFNLEILSQLKESNVSMLLAIFINHYSCCYFGHLLPISKTFQVRRTRHARLRKWSKDELISNVLLWTPSHGRASVGRPAKFYLRQLCTDARCRFEDPPGAMHNGEQLAPHYGQENSC